MTGEEPSVSAEDEALAASLVEQWRDVTTGQSSARLLHAASQVQLADGQGWPSADGEPIEWAPARAYDFANVGVARNGDLLVVSFDAVVSDLVMEGEEYRAIASPRLLTYLQSLEGRGTDRPDQLHRPSGNPCRCGLRLFRLLRPPA